MTPLEILESLTNVEHLATAAGPETGSAALIAWRSGPGLFSFSFKQWYLPRKMNMET